MLKASKYFPTDQDLRRSLIEMDKWSAFKTGVTVSVRSEKHNREKSMENQWRK
jgi:hypothetical protein